MRPPSRWLAPGPGPPCCPPPTGRQGAGPGDQRPPPTPPPLPLRPKSGRRQTEVTAAPHPPLKRPLHPGCGGTTAEAGARTPCLLPARGRRGRGPGRGADRAQRRRPPGNPHGTGVPRWGTLETTDGRPTPGGAGRPPHPPPASPPSLGATGAALRPPGAEGTPPPPRRDRDAGGGRCGWTCTPRAPAPPAACSRGGRGRRASPHQRAGATRTPSLGAAHGSAPEQYGGRAPHYPPVTTAHSGRAEGGVQVCRGPRGSAPPAAPHPPPARDGSATQTARARRRGVRRRHEGGQDGVPQAATQKRSREAAARPTPPKPPHRPASRGSPGPHPPRQGGWSPPPPERGAGGDPPPRPSRRLPQGPRRTSEHAPTRQDDTQIAPREGGRARTGVVWGATPPMDRTTPVTPALLPAQGRQRDRPRQSDPPPYRPPPAAQTGGTAHAPPPPPPPRPASRHTNSTDPPRGAQPPLGVQAKGTEKGPHTRTPAPTTRG